MKSVKQNGMTTLETKTFELNDLIIKGEGLKAMELFYAENVTMQENEDSPRTGKLLCLEHERRNMEKVKRFNGKLLNQVIDSEKNIVFSEWEINFESIANKKMTLTEVSVQHWYKGEVLKEKFYYKEIYQVN